MSNQHNKGHWLLVFHLSFWLLVSAIAYLVYFRLLGDSRMAMVASGVNLIGLVILIYGHLFFLLPAWYDQKKYLAYASGLLLLLVSTSALRFYLGWWMVRLFGWPIADEFSPTLFGTLVFGGAFFLLLSLPLRLIQNWFKKLELEQALNTQRLEAELRFLKAQVNPHFLFNALNNIYSLSFNQSEQTPTMILKLSDMMSYMLYDCKSELVPLQAEIDYLKNYIDLQQLKKEGEMQVSFDVEAPFSHQKITPMLLIPFFENAFKHGNLEDVANGWLKARLYEVKQQLHFDISNSYRTSLQNKPQKGGVGLENIRQRLALIYPNKHQLSMTNARGTFSVQLILDLRP